MSGPLLTVPPPQDDDHDDVAWALRAASAQWRREAVVDAVGWVRRAAETAEEVGAYVRAAELNRLARLLEGGRAAVAPPPPARALSIGDDDVEVEVDVDGVELLDDFDEAFDEVDAEPVDDDISFEELAAPDAAPPPSSVGRLMNASRAPAPLPPVRSAPSVSADLLRRAGTSPARPSSSTLDLPPSMRPVPSGLDLAHVPEDEVDFGELQFDEEPTTRKVSVSSVPPLPELGHVRLEGQSQVPLDGTTAAEYAAARGVSPTMRDHEALERELGLDLSVRGHIEAPPPEMARARSALSTASESFSQLGEPAASFGQSVPQEMRAVGARPIAALYDDDPFGAAVSSPVPGRASVRPSRPPEGLDRVTSALAEPYSLAPSAVLPPAETRSPGEARALPPVIEPPSRPSTAPPPHEMYEPEDRASSLPSVRPDAIPSSVPPPASVLSMAPEPDEFEDMFDALSRPPPKPAGKPSDSLLHLKAPPSPEFEAPPPQFLASSPPSSANAVALSVDGVDFSEVLGLQDLPEGAAHELIRSARLVHLKHGEEVSSFGVALVTHGAVQLMPTVADAACAFARKGEVLFTHGTLESSIALKVVGSGPESRVAVFSQDAYLGATSGCPWVAEELAQVANRYLALAGAVLGPLGDSLDEVFRFMVLDKCVVKAKTEGESVAVAGKSVDGMYLVGAGTLEVLAADGSVKEELGSGDFMFPETVFSAGPAPHAVRAGSGGALVLYATRMSIHELLATCPPFIELLAS